MSYPKMRFDTNELANILNVSTATIRIWSIKLGMPHAKNGKHYIFNITEVYEWIKRNSKTSDKRDINRWRKYRRVLFKYICLHYDAYTLHSMGYTKKEDYDDD